MKTLYLIRGLPGTGKSALAGRICFAEAEERHRPEPRTLQVEANDFFLTSGNKFVFDTTKVKEAHERCMDTCAEAMHDEVDIICVTNPFIKLEQMVPYEQLAAKHGYQVVIITCHTFLGNDHDVPLSTLRKMRSQMEFPTTLLPTS